MAYVCISYSEAGMSVGETLSEVLRRRGHAVFVSATDAADEGGKKVDKISLLVSDLPSGLVFEDLVDPRTNADMRAVAQDIEDRIAGAREAQAQDDEIRTRQKAATEAQNDAKTLSWRTAFLWNSLGVVLLVSAAWAAVRVSGGLHDLTTWAQFGMVLGRAMLEVAPLAICANFALKLGGAYRAEAQQCGDRIWDLVPKDLPVAAAQASAATPAR